MAEAVRLPRPEEEAAQLRPVAAVALLPRLEAEAAQLPRPEREAAVVASSPAAAARLPRGEPAAGAERASSVDWAGGAPSTAGGGGGGGGADGVASASGVFLISGGNQQFLRAGRALPLVFGRAFFGDLLDRFRRRRRRRGRSLIGRGLENLDGVTLDFAALGLRPWSSRPCGRRPSPWSSPRRM